MPRLTPVDWKKFDKFLLHKWFFGIAILLFIVGNWNIIQINDGLFYMSLLVIAYIILDYIHLIPFWKHFRKQEKNK